MAFPPLGNSDHFVVSLSIDFPTNSERDAPFHRIAYDYSRADWDGLRDHLGDVPREDIFKLGASAAAIVHRNHFLCFYQREKSSDSKVKFRQASNCCKRVLEDAKLAYANKTRVHYFPETWLS